MGVVERIPFTEILRSAVLRDGSSASVMYLARGASAYSSGQQDGNLYLIEEGQIKLVSDSPDGKRCLLSVMVEGEFFGELAILSGTRMETATAMKPTVLRRVPASRLAAALQREHFAEDFALHLLSLLSDQQRVIANRVTMTSERRLAAALLELAWKVGKRQGVELRIDRRITHEDLSEMVGTTRSRVGFFLKNFRREGLIACGGSAHLTVNEPRLVRYLATD
ncbi:Crp/Fnr family transcriptional regulator [Streptomyces sp. NBC_01485]|uniref:Crp/Fnr family transcriptional regulator n=1 Tax=Streptomyces sp. NBC_01485 TaxID=2903884 RepID=UPI002E337563|nr:Crp/Fnr family transcriptional regulator [Streptomyces sp. NBC_01485]